MIVSANCCRLLFEVVLAALVKCLQRSAVTHTSGPHKISQITEFFFTLTSYLPGGKILSFSSKCRLE